MVDEVDPETGSFAVDCTPIGSRGSYRDGQERACTIW